MDSWEINYDNKIYFLAIDEVGIYATPRAVSSNQAKDLKEIVKQKEYSILLKIFEFTTITKIHFIGDFMKVYDHDRILRWYCTITSDSILREIKFALLDYSPVNLEHESNQEIVKPNNMPYYSAMILPIMITLLAVPYAINPDKELSGRGSLLFYPIKTISVHLGVVGTIILGILCFLWTLNKFLKRPKKKQTITVEKFMY
ncbi:hypothetical protein [Aquimarina rhabdastrellae]